MSIAASYVISDQTELRLLEQSPRRTDNLIHTWGNRNGTVGDLLKILEGLQWFRARDIILQCMYGFCIIVSCRCLFQLSTTSHALTSQVVRWILWLLHIIVLIQALCLQVTHLSCAETQCSRMCQFSAVITRAYLFPFLFSDLYRDCQS